MHIYNHCAKKFRKYKCTTNRVTRSTGLKKGHTLHLPKETDKKTNNGPQKTTQKKKMRNKNPIESLPEVNSDSPWHKD